MDFHTYTTIRDWARQSGDRLADKIDPFYKEAMADGVRMRSGQFLGQCVNERDWEKLRRPYYNVFPAIVPMLTRLDLDLDSDLVRLPLPALCVRFPKDPARNPLRVDWKGEQVPIRCILVGDMDGGKGISVLIDIGEVMPGGVPIYTYRNFPRKPGLTVEQSLAGLGKKGLFADVGIVIPDSLVTDCVRLCCSLCLLENDPSVISPDVLADDRARFERTGDEKYVCKAHRRGKVGWNVGQQIEVAPHYRRPHMALVWTGHGRVVPRIVPRRGSVVHREVVEKVPMGFGGATKHAVQ
jgi:hypothetical protein